MASEVESTPSERVPNVYWYSNVIHVQVNRVVVVAVLVVVVVVVLMVVVVVYK
jgi:hypothetical protein